MTAPPYLGLARKFRPQQFKEVVGQDSVSTTLRNSLLAGKPSHAYLFFGPRGAGKTTTARILAKALNCEGGLSPSPCDRCSSCREIARSESIDVLELDAATNTQVDRIREMIIETVALAPSRDRYKIFIIDEVHMLSTASFNALLKTLEEPPAHVVFILATTDPGKIPPTIVSRCQRFRFRALSPEIIESLLSQVAKEEGISADSEALRILSTAAGGAVRDALCLLEQAHAYSGGKVTAQTIGDLLGALPEELLLALAGGVLQRDCAQLSRSLDRVWEEGFDPAQLLRDMRERMRLAYLYRLGVVSDIGGEWAKLAGPHTADEFSFILQKINKALETLRFADSPKLNLELAFYGMIQASYDLREWVRRLEALEKKLSLKLEESSVAPEAVAAQDEAPPPSEEEASVPTNLQQPPAEVSDVWAIALRQMEEEKPGLASDLREAKVVALEGSPWRLLFRRSFDAERAQRHKKEIEERLASVRGRPVQVLFEVDGGSSKQAEKEARASSPAGSEPAGTENPAVQKVLQIFPGKVRFKK